MFGICDGVRTVEVESVEEVVGKEAVGAREWKWKWWERVRVRVKELCGKVWLWYITHSVAKLAQREY